MVKLLHLFIRNYSTYRSGYYVSTPIFYVNAAPHVGHLYSGVIADAVYRYQKIKNAECKLLKFSTGTDEHGIKIQQAADQQKIDVDKYCEKISKKYKEIFDLAGIQYTDFIRTSEERHKRTVHQFWNILKTKDLIYSSTYCGWYCVSDETFLTENQLKTNLNGVKVSTETGHPVEWTEEKNYLFKLSKLQNDVVKWINEGNHIKPKKFEKILLDYLREPLPDLSISRPISRVHWGIKVPNDETQTIYVWLDALVNYLTCSEYFQLDGNEEKNTTEFWPPTLQVIGKDILKFHGIYWPAFLIGAELEPPECLLVHSHWTVDGEKMSKSKLNVVDPVDRARVYTMEGLRYFLLREGVAHSDGNYSDIKILRILNSELADTLGNLLSRCCAKSLNPRQIYPTINEMNHHFNDVLKLDVTERLMEALNQLPEKCEEHYEDYNFYMVVDQIMKILHLTNNFFESCKPWELIKNHNIKINSSNKNKNHKVNITMNGVTEAYSVDNNNEYLNKLETIISITMNILRVCGIILQPIIPEISKKLLDKLNIPEDERYWKNIDGSQCFEQMQNQNERRLHPTNTILFRRIITEQNKSNKNVIKLR